MFLITMSCHYKEWVIYLFWMQNYNYKISLLHQEALYTHTQYHKKSQTHILHSKGCNYVGGSVGNTSASSMNSVCLLYSLCLFRKGVN